MLMMVRNFALLLLTFVGLPIKAETPTRASVGDCLPALMMAGCKERMDFIMFKKIVRRMSEIKTEDDLVCCFSDIDHAFDAELISFSEHEMLYALAEKVRPGPQLTSVGMRLTGLRGTPLSLDFLTVASKGYATITDLKAAVDSAKGSGDLVLKLQQLRLYCKLTGASETATAVRVAFEDPCGNVRYLNIKKV